LACKILKYVDVCLVFIFYKGPRVTVNKPKVLLDVSVPKHLDSSLIDVDVHPNYVSVVIKGKVLRLTLPAEVDSSHASAQRSKITGHLVLSMPKVNPDENALGLRVGALQRKRETEMAARAAQAQQASRDSQHLAYQLQADAKGAATTAAAAAALSSAGGGPARSSSNCGGSGGGSGSGPGGGSGGAAVVPTGGAVKLQGLVGARHGGLKQEPAPPMQLHAVSTTLIAPLKLPPPPKAPATAYGKDSGDEDEEGPVDDNEPPPPM
jgi:protein TilB